MCVICAHIASKHLVPLHAVYVDHFTKQTHVLPINESINAEGVADFHVKEIFRLHGIPRKIVSDRGALFAAQVTKALGINIGLTTAYHPAANGQVERKKAKDRTIGQNYCQLRNLF